MQAYRQHLIIENPQQLVLHDLPLQAGQTVEVLVLVTGGNTKDNSKQRRRELETLLDLSWGCVGKTKTRAEIDAEIVAMRQEWTREWD